MSKFCSDWTYKETEMGCCATADAGQADEARNDSSTGRDRVRARRSKAWIEDGVSWDGDGAKCVERGYREVKSSAADDALSA